MIMERWYGPAVVIGHACDGGAQRYSYWLPSCGKCALVIGLHLRPADIEECVARAAVFKEITQSLRQASHGVFSYIDLRGDRSSGELGQQEPVSRLMLRFGEEDTLVFRRVTMAPSRAVIPQSSWAAPYNPETPVVPPESYGPVRTPVTPTRSYPHGSYCGGTRAFTTNSSF